LRSIITKALLSLIFLATLAFASNEVGANFVYDYGEMYETGLKSENLDLSAKIMFQNPLFFNWNSTDIEINRGKIALFSASFPFGINSYVLEPAVLFGRGVWEEGDFQYFYGKPDLPIVFGFGMSFYKGSNSLTVNYVYCGGKILNNQGNVELFNSDFYIYNALYKFNANRNLNLYAGFAGLNVEAYGALTAENQGYFLFPYLFYEIKERLNIKTIYGDVNLRLEFASAEYGIDLGALVAISEKMAGTLHYKYRKKFASYYGEKEVFRDFYPSQIRGNGIIFSILSIQTKKIRLGENYIQYGVKKPLAIPFGNFFSESKNFNDPEHKMSIKDALLWGLTANASLYF